MPGNPHIQGPHSQPLKPGEEPARVLDNTLPDPLTDPNAPPLPEAKDPLDNPPPPVKAPPQPAGSATGKPAPEPVSEKDKKPEPPKAAHKDVHSAPAVKRKETPLAPKERKK